MRIFPFYLWFVILPLYKTYFKFPFDGTETMGTCPKSNPCILNKEIYDNWDNRNCVDYTIPENKKFIMDFWVTVFTIPKCCEIFEPPVGDYDCGQCISGKSLEDGCESSCIDVNCQVCTKIIICELCVVGFSVSNNICVPCADVNCADCRVNKDTCQTCKSGFVKTINQCGSVSACSDTNCVDCSGDKDICKACKAGYSAKNNICVEDCCDGNCNDCSGNIEICKACKAGYSTKNNFCVEDCCDGNCDDCSGNIEICKACKAGYSAKNNICVEDCCDGNCND
jgi:hypothetical protein